MLTAGGAAAVTMFETAGPRGVIDAAGRPHPCFHVLADVVELRAAASRATRSSDPLAVRALAADGPGGPTILLANLTAEPVAVELEGARARRCRLLDATSAAAAAGDPVGFRRDGWTGADQALKLPPHAVARLQP